MKSQSLGCTKFLKHVLSAFVIFALVATGSGCRAAKDAYQDSEAVSAPSVEAPNDSDDQEAEPPTQENPGRPGIRIRIFDLSSKVNPVKEIYGEFLQENGKVLEPYSLQNPLELDIGEFPDLIEIKFSGIKPLSHPLENVSVIAKMSGCSSSVNRPIYKQFGYTFHVKSFESTDDSITVRVRGDRPESVGKNFPKELYLSRDCDSHELQVSFKTSSDEPVTFSSFHYILTPKENSGGQ